MASLSDLISGNSQFEFASPASRRFQAQRTEQRSRVVAFNAMPESTYDEVLAKYNAAKQIPGDTGEQYIEKAQEGLYALARRDPSGFKPFIDEWNSGQQVSNPIAADLFQSQNQRHTQGEISPGSGGLTPERLQAMANQRVQDASPSGWDREFDKAVAVGIPLAAGMLLGPMGAAAMGAGTAASVGVGALAGSQAGRHTGIGWEGGALAGAGGGYIGAGMGAGGSSVGAGGAGGTGGGMASLPGGAPIMAADVAGQTGLSGLLAGQSSSLGLAGTGVSAGTGAAAVGTLSGLSGTGAGIGAGTAGGIYGATGLTGGQLALGLGGIGAGLYGTQQNKKAMDEAAKTNAAATQGATDLQGEMFNQTQANQRPWLEAGTRALGKQEALLNDPSLYQQDPYNAWLQEQGRTQLDRSASSRGQTFSGGTLKELLKYGQGMAGQGFNDQYNRLATLSGTGQAGASNMAGQANQYAQNVGNLNMQNAQTQGNLSMAKAGQNNALVNNLFNTGASMYGMYNQNQQNQNLLNALYGRG